MKKLLALTLICVLLILAGTAIAASGASSGLAKVEQAKPTQEGVLALADKYNKFCEPKLEDQDKTAIKEIKDTLAQKKRAGEAFYKPALRDSISQLTLKLASAKSLDALTVASVFLLKEAPKNPRTANLFGSVLHTMDKYKDAITVFQYAQSLDPKNNLIKLNLANAYLDDNQDSKAKALLDKLEFEDSGNKAVYRALATYYYKQKNAAKFREYLFKASNFKGFKRAKSDKKKQKVEQNEVTPADATGSAEAKLKQLEQEVPLTPADLIEEEYPQAAQQIRNKYGKLQDNERWLLPKLPMVNLNGPKDFAQNQPIVDEWVNVNTKKLEYFPRHQARQMGINPDASDDVIEKQGQAAAKKKAAEAMQKAQQAIKAMENMPGISKADIAKAKSQLEKAMAEQGINAQETPEDTTIPAALGMDSGSVFAYDNWTNHRKIQDSYNNYFRKYYGELQAKIVDIVKVYANKVKAENDAWAKEKERLQEVHDRSIDANPNGPHSGVDAPCREAEIAHRERLNSIADSAYKQWSGLYMPQYAQKMKPTLDAYFNISMLYIRNMNDPKVMEEEYNKATMTYVMYSLQAIGYINTGESFEYDPSTEEARQQLEQDIARAKEEAESKREEFKREFKSPEFSFTDWINDHFVLEVSGEFLALKITPHSIEFEAYVPGVGAGAKYDFTEQKFETYTGVGAKLDIGVNICGLGAKAEAKGDFYRRTATWDLANGKYYETDSAKAEAKGSLGPLSAGGEFELDTQLNAKVAGKVSFMDTLTIQGQQELK